MLLFFAFHFSGISFCKEPIEATLCQKPLSLVEKLLSYPGEYNVSANYMNLEFANIASAIISSVADFFKKNPHINKFEIRGIYLRNEKLIDQVMRYGFKKVFSGETVLNLYIQSTLALAGAGAFSLALISDLNPTHKIIASSTTLIATILSLWAQNHWKTRRGNYSLTISRNEFENLDLKKTNQ